MAKYRKKPVVIEAVEWKGPFAEPLDWPDWFHIAIIHRTALPLDDGRLYISTLEGAVIADLGDMIIKGVKGELYPCKPDIFAATYEAVDA